MTNATAGKKELEKALANAVASARMEGFPVTEAHIQIAEALVLGTLTKEEALTRILAERA
jgi:hypothetical protein